MVDLELRPYLMIIISKYGVSLAALCIVIRNVCDSCCSPADAVTLASQGEIFVGNQWVHTVHFSRDGSKIVVGDKEDIKIFDAGNFRPPAKRGAILMRM